MKMRVNELVKLVLFYHKKGTQAVEMWLIAQMKAYSMLMKDWTFLCGRNHLCRLF